MPEIRVPQLLHGTQNITTLQSHVIIDYTKAAVDDDAAERLWKVSAKLVGLKCNCLLRALKSCHKGLDEVYEDVLVTSTAGYLGVFH